MPEEAPKVIPVKAVLRGRPLIQKEIGEGCEICLEFFSDINQVNVSGNKPFTFDHVFGSDVGQEEVYETAVRPLTEGIFKGYHATVFAYGQTGSGKTYSMGSAHSSTDINDATTGIIPRVISDIFNGISDRKELDFQVKVSYLELYKTDLNDLLVPAANRQTITIRDAPDGGTKLVGLTELTVHDIQETLNAMGRGNSHRTTAATAMNLVSSRSHAIFTIILQCSNKDIPGDLVCSKFHLVDLAGSERVKRTKAEGERLQEGIKINEGLLALGNVISALADDNLRSGHIKYRDSKLTRILQSSLGGNSHTVMIACVSPADSNREETLNTLRYADRVRKIKNVPVVNRDPQAALIASLRQEIQTLNLRLLEGGGAIGLSSSGDIQNNSKLLEKVRKLESGNAELTVQLQESSEMHAEMCEKVIIGELALENMKEQLKNIVLSAEGILKEFPDITISLGENLETEEAKEQLSKLLGLLKLSLGAKVIEGNELLEDGLEESPTTSAQARQVGTPTDDEEHITAEHAIKKADLGKQLQDLMKRLATKEELAKKMSGNPQVTAIRVEYEAKLQQLDTDIQNLAKEKSDLEHALQQAQKTSESRQLSEKRRQRVLELEKQIQDLRKEKKEKERLVRLKTDGDRSIERLNKEIVEMKRNRVNLMKQIKVENLKFNTWKKEKAKEVKQLQEKNRKRNFEYVKLERTYDKQKAILRRKTEEAAAANKRLKEALSKQQATAAKRRANTERKSESAGPKIRAWLDEEVEVLSSTKEVEHHLNELFADRKVLTQELQNRNSDSPNKRRRTFNKEDKSSRLDDKAEIRQEIKLKNAQIQDLQIKLSEAKERHNDKTRWSHIGTMVEARCAMKYLLQLTVDGKMEESKQRKLVIDAKKNRDSAVELAKELETKMRNLVNQSEHDKLVLEKSHQEEISLVMSRMNTSLVSDLPKAPAEQATSVVAKQAAIIGNLKGENKELHRQLLEQRLSASGTPKPAQNRTFFQPIPHLEASESEETFDEEDDEWESSDVVDDPEYRPTPVKRAKRTTMQIQKVIGCGCRKFVCKGALCGCVKKTTKCGIGCKCDPSLCRNRDTITDDKAEDDSATLNATFIKETGSSNSSLASSTPTNLFPKLRGFEDSQDQENMSPDIIPRTPLENSKHGTYTPVYFKSPLQEQNSAEDVF